METSLKAIETRYKGYRFRSRLEARWAVFFDALGLRWEYEPQGFDLGGVRYLPDFRVTSPQGMVTWYEIKPEQGGDESKLQRFAALWRATTNREDDKTSFQVLAGDPAHVLLEFDQHPRGSAFFLRDSSPAKLNPFFCCPRCGDISNDHPCFPIRYGGQVSFWCERCDFDTPCGGGHDFEPGLLARCAPYKGSLVIDDPHWVRAARKVEQAAMHARSARFEHGGLGAFMR